MFQVLKFLASEQQVNKITDHDNNKVVVRTWCMYPTILPEIAYLLAVQA